MKRIEIKTKSLYGKAGGLLALVLVASQLIGVGQLFTSQTANAAFPGYNGSIAYVTGDPAQEAFTLYTANLDGTDKQSVSGEQNVLFPAWSADGHKISWTGYTPDNGDKTDVFVANADGSGVINVSNLDFDEKDRFSAAAQSFHPNGETVIYNEYWESGSGEEAEYFCSLHTVSVEGTNKQTLSGDEQYCDSGAEYSPDGSKIAFFRADWQEGTVGLYTMNANGTGLNLLQTIEDTDPFYLYDRGAATLDWSPDGSTLLFSSTLLPPVINYSLIPSSGGQSEEIIASGFTGTEDGTELDIVNSASFTPEGQILYTHTIATTGENFSNTNGASTIEMMNTDGSNLQIIESVEVEGGDNIAFFGLLQAFVSPTIQPVATNPGGPGGSDGPNTRVLTNPETNQPILLELPEGTEITCSDTEKESSLSEADPYYDYSVGLVNFCFDTESLENEVSLTFITDLKPEDVVSRKYNSINKTFFNLPESSSPTIVSTIYEGQSALKLTYTITDNGDLDLNPAVGEITDPVGLATRTVSSPNTGIR